MHLAIKRSGLWLTALLAILLSAGSLPALAHTRLISSQPAAGAALSSAPKQVVLQFTAPPEPGFTNLQWSGPKGGVWHTLKPEEHDNQVEATLPKLEPGRYKVRWSVLSRDGHRQRGVIEFQIH